MACISKKLDHRRFLNVALGGVAWILLAGVPGCVEEELGASDSDGYTVWIAQSIAGTVRHNSTQDPIADATVQLFAGFDEDTRGFPISDPTTTSSEGYFSIIRAEETDTAGDFWWFVVPDQEPRTVYVKLEITHPDYFPANPKKILIRVPDKDRPTRNLGAYALTFSVVMEFISGQDP